MFNKILMGSFRPPDTTCDEWDDAIKIIKNTIEDNKNENKDILWAGDLNFPQQKME